MLRIASSNTRECPGSMDLLDFGIVCLGYCIFSYTPHLFFRGAWHDQIDFAGLTPKEDKCGRGRVDAHRHQKSLMTSLKDSNMDGLLIIINYY